jgi:hypothetical protein
LRRAGPASKESYRLGIDQETEIAAKTQQRAVEPEIEVEIEIEIGSEKYGVKHVFANYDLYTCFTPMLDLQRKYYEPSVMKDRTAG